MTRFGRTMTNIALLVVGFLMGWYSLAWLSLPTENDFMIVTTSHYFEKMSENNFSHIAAYDDCRLEPATPSERRQEGIKMYGFCRAVEDDITYLFAVAMSPTANTIYVENIHTERRGE
mgnify:CR=1 FL=1